MVSPALNHSSSSPKLLFALNKTGSQRISLKLWKVYPTTAPQEMGVRAQDYDLDAKHFFYSSGKL